MLPVGGAPAPVAWPSGPVAPPVDPPEDPTGEPPAVEPLPVAEVVPAAPLPVPDEPAPADSDRLPDPEPELDPPVAAPDELPLAEELPPADEPDDDEPAELTVAVASPFWAAASVANCCWAFARSACALSSADCKPAGSMVARVCPAVTASPTFTATEETWPATGKATSARSLAVTVPTEVRSALTDPIVATAVRTVDPDEAVRATASPAPIAVKATTPATANMSRRRRARILRACTAIPDRGAGAGWVGIGSVGLSVIS